MEIVMKSANSKLRPLTAPLPSDHSAERWLLRAKERESKEKSSKEKAFSGVNLEEEVGVDSKAGRILSLNQMNDMLHLMQI